MNTISQFLDVMLHLDKYLGVVINSYGMLTYVILFIIVFCETGLVVTPLLPGDSLLFAAAAFAGTGVLNIFILLLLFGVAAILGDTVNYHIGRYLGPKVFEKKNSKIFKKEYLDKTNSFYEKYGGKTIIIARFVPIVRTFAPFVAGVGKMNYSRFLLFNAIGGIMWVLLVGNVGYFFGNLPIVEKNFSLVIIAIIFISLLPAIIEFLRHKIKKAN